MNPATPHLSFFTKLGWLVLPAALCIDSAAAAEPKTELLWPSGAPGALGVQPKDAPTLIIYLPDKPGGTAGSPAVVICPGGGYTGLAMDHEGHQIGRWL